MKRLEYLKSNSRDKILYDFISENLKNENLINSASGTASGLNRGDLFEIAITGEPVKRNGLHEVSGGDWFFNGEPVEIKYLTTKTKASKTKATICKKHLIGFNTGKEIEIYLIDNKEIEYTSDNKISYQLNYKKGVRVNL